MHIYTNKLFLQGILSMKQVPQEYSEQHTPFFKYSELTAMLLNLCLQHVKIYNY